MFKLTIITVIKKFELKFGLTIEQRVIYGWIIWKSNSKFLVRWRYKARYKLHKCLYPMLKYLISLCRAVACLHRPPHLSPSTCDEKSHQGRDQNGWVIGSTGLSQLVHQGSNPGTLGNLNTLSYHRQHTHGGINIWQYCEFVLHENGSGGDSDVSSQHKHGPQLT